MHLLSILQALSRCRRSARCIQKRTAAVRQRDGMCAAEFRTFAGKNSQVAAFETFGRISLDISKAFFENRTVGSNSTPSAIPFASMHGAKRRGADDARALSL
jgi:hypothetical protein